jgi:hypothetical protein
VHTVDVLAVCAAVLVLCGTAALLARQRYMLRLPGAIELAVQLPSRRGRWLYGMGRFANGELRWYRPLGFGSRPSRVLRRGSVEILRRREPAEDERSALSHNVVVLDCRSQDGPFSMALGEGAYTGFMSWLESSAPMS